MSFILWFLIIDGFFIFVFDMVIDNVCCLFSDGIIDVIFCFNFLYYLLDICLV